MKRDPFAHRLRESGAYRQDRLEVERHRLQRRILWADKRGDRQAVAWLEEKLSTLEEEIDADLAPGKAPGRFDQHRRK